MTSVGFSLLSVYNLYFSYILYFVFSSIVLPFWRNKVYVYIKCKNSEFTCQEGRSIQVGFLRSRFNCAAVLCLVISCLQACCLHLPVHVRVLRGLELTLVFWMSCDIYMFIIPSHISVPYKSQEGYFLCPISSGVVSVDW